MEDRIFQVIRLIFKGLTRLFNWLLYIDKSEDTKGTLKIYFILFPHYSGIMEPGGEKNGCFIGCGR